MGLPGLIQLDSRALAWPNLRVMRVQEPCRTDPFDVHVEGAQSLVLIKRAAEHAGRHNIECRRGSGWTGARYAEGDLGMVAPRRGATLRWSNLTGHTTVHLSLCERLLEEAARDAGTRVPYDRLDRLSHRDATTRAVVLALEQAAESGASARYADSAAHFLAAHLVGAQASDVVVPPLARPAEALRRLDEFLRDNLARDFPLSEVAGHVGLSSFQVIRLCKAHHGETPFRRLQRLRIERARDLLQERALSVTAIAFECGYASQSALGAAFLKAVGMTPSQYRRQ